MQLPSYIKNSKSIISLTNNHQTGKPYTDNKCFFRCLSLARGKRMSGLERLTDHLLQQFENHTQETFKSGITLKHIPALEIFFKVSINIYSFNEDQSCDVV